MTDLSVIKPRAYNFTADFFSANIHLFEQFLGDLKDKPCRLLEIGSYEGRIHSRYDPSHFPKL
jgi:hypothetical protein